MIARLGYTLPVFACASALAAIECLKGKKCQEVSIDLINPKQIVKIPIEQVALINSTTALGITRSDPGDNLDITRNTPVWALVETKISNGGEKIIIKGGDGIGKLNNQGKAAIYSYAEKLLRSHLDSYIVGEETIEVTIILPFGKELSDRTSNAAFGVVEGLSLLGTSGISQPLSAPEQLDIYQQELREKASKFDSLVFCVGENGLDLGQKLGINPQQMIKTANWLGPMLVAAAIAEVKSILLFGYHGKLIKLAGGIFHTHHHLADGRLEILTANLANLGLPTNRLQKIFACETTEAALQLLREWDSVEQVYGTIAAKIDSRSQEYIYSQSGRNVRVGSILFDRKREIIVKSSQGTEILSGIMLG